VREGKGTKEGQTVCWKSGGGTSASLYLAKDRAGGGESGHGVAKPDGVIYM